MIFRSKEGLHVWMDWNAGYLYFPDGSKWYMGSHVRRPGAGCGNAISDADDGHQRELPDDRLPGRERGHGPGTPAHASA